MHWRLLLSALAFAAHSHYLADKNINIKTAMSKKNSNNGGGITIHRPKTQSEFYKLNRELNNRGYVAIDLLKPGKVRDISLALGDAANAGAQDMAAGMGCGLWSNGPLSKVAWSFDGHDNTTEHVTDIDGKDLGEYVKWGAADNIPSVIPPLAMSSPYTAAPLRYIADLISGLGVRLMYRFPDGKLVLYKDAGEILRDKVEELEKEDDGNLFRSNDGSVIGQVTGVKENKALKRAKEALEEWERVWYGYDDKDTMGDMEHVPGAKEFLEENNLDLLLSQCMQDHVMLDIHFPTVGLQRGRRGAWKPKVVKCSMLASHSCRLSVMNQWRHIDWIFFSDSLRSKGAISTQTLSTAAQDRSFKRYPAAMPQNLLSDMRYIVESNQRTRIKDRPTWIVCPTFYPSLNKPYYPQPAWWSVFTSKAFDFSATILYDKYKQRDNATSFSKIIYVSLDYLNDAFSTEGLLGDKDKQQEFIDNLDQSMEAFLQRRENNGKTMRQWMWTGPDGKEHKSVEIADIQETTADAVKAGKEELELSTSPIFLALQVDPRLVGVPMVAASNGGTALREMHLLKQQQLSIHQRLFLNWLNTAVCVFNGWSDGGRAEFHIIQQTLTTLDASKTGTVETVANETDAKI